MERKMLLDALRRVQGACASNPPVPAMGSVFFDGCYATTYDGELAIRTPCQLPVDGGVELKPLVAWVSGCAGPVVSVQVKGEVAHFKCGRSTFKAPLVDRDQLVFDEPRGVGVWIADEGTLMPAIQRAAGFMGNDQAHPTRMGLTVTVEAMGQIKLYATDNITMVFDAIANGGMDSPFAVVLPPRFVKLLLSMQREGLLTSIEIGDGWAYGSFYIEDLGDEYAVFTRTGTEVAIDDYQRVFNNVLGSVDKMGSAPITDEVRDAIKHVAAVLNALGENECQLEIAGGELTVKTAVDARASATQTVPNVEHANGSIQCAAKELVRIIEGSKWFTFNDTALVAWGDTQVSLLAAIS